MESEDVLFKIKGHVLILIEPYLNVTSFGDQFPMFNAFLKVNDQLKVAGKGSTIESAVTDALRKM